MNKGRQVHRARPGRLDQLAWLAQKATQEKKELRASAAKPDHQDRLEWLDHLDRWVLREPPGSKGQSGHRGNRARRGILDRRDQLAWQVQRAIQVKKERKASAVNRGHQARLG